MIDPKQSARKKITGVIDELQGSLSMLSEMGWRGFDCSKQSIDILSSWGRKRSDLPETLPDIRTHLGDCRRCRLSEGRKNIVFGEGNARARLMFVGDGPGFDEDVQGAPFVGAAGRLLMKIILAIKENRESVYISNVVKCRPPENRNPLPDEIQTCFPFLKRQIQSIRPRYICALGTVAAQTLIHSTDSISAMRGRFYDHMGIAVLPTYHPAHLLRHPEKKRDVWEDMKRLMTAMGTSTGNTP